MTKKMTQDQADTYFLKMMTKFPVNDQVQIELKVVPFGSSISTSTMQLALKPGTKITIQQTNLPAFLQSRLDHFIIKIDLVEPVISAGGDDELVISVLKTDLYKDQEIEIVEESQSEIAQPEAVQKHAASSRQPVVVGTDHPKVFVF